MWFFDIQAVGRSSGKSTQKAVQCIKSTNQKCQTGTSALVHFEHKLPHCSWWGDAPRRAPTGGSQQLAR